MPGPVCSYTEWDPLEEVIVGSARGAAELAFEPALAPYYEMNHPFRRFQGARYSESDIQRAQTQLDGFARLLESEGIIVRRPDPVDHFRPFVTPDFEVPCGHASACPRDVLLVVGDEIIEAPMAQRGRFFEYRAYRSLVKEYFSAGARWTTAPKPTMSDALYHQPYTTEDQQFDATAHPLLTEFEPCFDAASLVRFGKDIFWQPDVVSNAFGIAWLQRHLGREFRIHRIEFVDKAPQHIDTTLVPIRPGLVLTNPERPCKDGSVSIFTDNGWEVLPAPSSVRVEGATRDVSNWISMNFLSLDEHTVVIEEAEEPMIRFLENLGCRVLTCPFDQVFQFGGSFHCCTTDVRRRGELRSYFPMLD